MINWNGYERKRVSTFVTNVYIFLRETAKNHEISQKASLMTEFSVRDLRSHKATHYLLNQTEFNIFVKLKHENLQIKSIPNTLKQKSVLILQQNVTLSYFILSLGKQRRVTNAA